MKFAWLGCLLLGGLLFAGQQDSDDNVNTRYTVETVILSGRGWSANLASERTDRISTSLLQQLAAIIGQKLNPAALDTLAASLKKELSAREVTHRIVRGDGPERVRVEFEVKPARTSLGMDVTQAAYDTKQGWTGRVEASFSVDQHTFAAGLVSDGDWLPERYAGLFARYEDRHLGSDRISLKFQAGSFHEQWNQASLTALAQGQRTTSDAYRDRQEFEPAVTVALARPLTLTVGARIERFDSENPAVGEEASNALTTALHYHWRLEGAGIQHDLDADCSLHAATRALDSDFAYAMRSAGVRYQFRWGKQVLGDSAWVGSIGGRAPLSDRFVLGNTYYLRGWNKYEIDPLGGNRVVHNSVDYRYGVFQAFYDVGAVWDEGQPAVPRHSLGVGFRESVFSLAVAFPIRSGHVEPILMMGILP